MSFKDVFVSQGKRLASHPSLLRLMTDDRVMRAFNGALDGQQRVKDAADKLGEAWHLLINGRALPTIDPALDDQIPTVEASRAGATSAAPVNGKPSAASAPPIRAT